MQNDISAAAQIERYVEAAVAERKVLFPSPYGLAPAEEEAYFRWCMKNNRPYFGSCLAANVAHEAKQLTIQEIAQTEARRRGDVNWLEIGSFVGTSACSTGFGLSTASKNFRIVCIDPWQGYDITAITEYNERNIFYPYFNEVLRSGAAYALFKHNVKACGFEANVMPLATSPSFLGGFFPEGIFDVVYIDGDHKYSGVKRDLEFCLPLLKPDGVVCGDDMEMELADVDAAFARANLEVDVCTDPKTGRSFHPGVTLAVGELVGRVAIFGGCWAARRVGAEKRFAPYVREPIRQDLFRTSYLELDGAWRR